MLLGFLKECIISLIFVGVNLLSLLTIFVLIKIKFVIFFPIVLQFHSFHNRKFWQIFFVHLIPISRTRLLLNYHNQFHKLSSVATCSFVFYLSIRCSFSIVPSAESKFIPILISSSLISVVWYLLLWLTQAVIVGSSFEDFTKNAFLF